MRAEIVFVALRSARPDALPRKFQCARSETALASHEHCAVVPDARSI